MLKKIVIAPDSFKGTMSSVEICALIAAEIRKYLPEAEVVQIPIADGGEGTVDDYLAGMGGVRRRVTVLGPMGEPVDAEYGILPDGKTAVIEMAAASGLPLVHGTKSPLDATTYGTGQLMADAAAQGCTDMILGIGGSATNDGGIGAMAALGVRFLDENGNTVTPDGKGLGKIARIDASGLLPAVRDVRITIACDVKNPLAGENGAANVFGPQKGATPEMVAQLDENLLHYNTVLTGFCGVDRRAEQGMGAAGGIALSLKAFLQAEITPGIELLLDTAAFDKHLEHADLVITGEGKIDAQSAQGKVPVGVARRAKKQGVAVVALVGDVGEGISALYDEGITAVFSTNKAAVPYEIARKTSAEDLCFLTESLLRFYCAVR